MTLFNPDGSLNTTAASGNDNELIDVTAGTGGTYSVRVYGSQGAENDYQLTATMTGANPPPDGDRPDAGGGGDGCGSGANLAATFSEAVQGVSNTTFVVRAGANVTTGPTVPATVTQVEGTNRYLLNPTSNLAASTTYTVTVVGGAAEIRDLAGAPLVTTSWTFTTVNTAAAATVIGSFTVDQAFATAVDEARDRVYVTRIGTPAIYAYDSNTFALVGVRTIANFPVTVEVNDVTGNVMVAHQGDGNKVTVLNSALNTLAVLELPNPWGPAVNSVTNRFYVANTFGGDVWVVDGASNALLTTINLDGDSTLGIAVDESRNRIYAADRYSNELDVIDGTTNTVIDTLATGSYPAWIDIDEVLGTVYVTNQDDGTISVFDAATLAPVGTIEVGGSPHRIAVNDTTHRAYVSLQNSDRVAVIDTATNAVVSEVVLPAGQPWHLSLDESTNRVFVPTYFANRVVVIQGDEPSEAIATSTSVVTSANPAPVNAPITLTATVAAATGPVVPTGCRDVHHRRRRPGAHPAHRGRGRADHLLARPRESPDLGVVHACWQRVPSQRQLRRAAHPGDRARAAGGDLAVTRDVGRRHEHAAAVQRRGLRRLRERTRRPDGRRDVQHQPQRHVHVELVPGHDDRHQGRHGDRRLADGHGHARRAGTPDHHLPDDLGEDDAAVARDRERDGFVRPAGLLHEHDTSGVRGGRYRRFHDHTPRPGHLHGARRPGRRRHPSPGAAAEPQLRGLARVADDHVPDPDRPGDHGVSGDRHRDVIVGPRRDLHHGDPGGVHRDRRRRLDHRAARCRHLHRAGGAGGRRHLQPGPGGEPQLHRHQAGQHHHLPDDRDEDAR